MAKENNTGDTLSLVVAQRNNLLAAKAWWQEGDRQLDYLAEHAKVQTLLTQAAAARDQLRSGSGSAVRAFLRLARAFAPNPVLNSTRETEDFTRALSGLFFGDAPLAERLTRFLSEARGVGALTVSQLLFVAFPDRYPFVTPTHRALLTLTLEQKRAARLEAEQRFGETDDPAALTLLGDFVTFDLVRQTLNLADFADLDAVLRHYREMPKGSAKRLRRSKTITVREETNEYAASTTPTLPEPTEHDLLRYLEGYIAAQGFTFPPLAVRNYYLALKTKPFVILAGLSGTGKTRLTELFAEAITDNLRAQYRLIPVRSDWSDPSPLLGYHNALTGHYIGTPFLDTIKEASRTESRNRPYFVCLDEMNLARVEHYMADILSAMETRRREIPLAGTFDAVTLSPNIFLAGTVNIEEGTHSFGLKVLDRANVIEFSEVNLSRPTSPAPVVLPEIAPSERQRLFLSHPLETVADAEARLAAADPSFVDQFHELLSALNDLLAERGMQFGYRVRDEALRYIAYSFTSDGSPLLTETEDPATNFRTALDLQILQRVLPRLTGTQERMDPLLTHLITWAEAEHLPRTAAKLTRMRRRATEEGIVSFYE